MLEQAHATAIQQTALRIRTHIAQAIIGKDTVVEQLLIALLCEGHVLLEDVPGTGKTTLARTLARTLNCTFQRIQCTPDLLPSDVTGLSFFNQKITEFQFRPGPIFANIVLTDEINRATPRTQSALLEAMQERTVTLDGTTRPLPRPFLVVATQNPIEFEGTFPLPEAQLDRFLMRLSMGYPDLSEEEQIILRYEHTNPIEQIAPIIQEDELRTIQRDVRHIGVSDIVRRYIVEIVRATRNNPEAELGASPRGSLALYHTSQARAAINGRAFVLPDDVKSMAETVLAHRIILSPEARLRGRTSGDIVRRVLEQIPAPVE